MTYMLNTKTDSDKGSWKVGPLLKFFKYHIKNNTILNVIKVDDVNIYKKGSGGAVSLRFKPNEEKGWVPITFFQNVYCKSLFNVTSPDADLYAQDTRTPNLVISKFDNEYMDEVKEKGADGKVHTSFSLKDGISNDKANDIVLLYECIESVLPKLVESAFESGKVIRPENGKDKKYKNKKDVLIANDSKVLDVLKTSDSSDVPFISIKWQFGQTCQNPTRLETKPANNPKEPWTEIVNEAIANEGIPDTKDKDKLKEYYRSLYTIEPYEVVKYVPIGSKVSFRGAITQLSFHRTGISLQSLLNKVKSIPAERDEKDESSEEPVDKDDDDEKSQEPMEKEDNTDDNSDDGVDDVELDE